MRRPWLYACARTCSMRRQEVQLMRTSGTSPTISTSPVLPSPVSCQWPKSMSSALSVLTSICATKTPIV